MAPIARLSLVVSFLGLVGLVPLLSDPPVHADDICGGSDERKKWTEQVKADLSKAERAGKQAELFLLYDSIQRDDCVAEDLRAKTGQALPKLGRDLAAKAEAQGRLYSRDAIYTNSGESRKANERASAFAWLEASNQFREADQVMLKAVRAKPDDLELFKAAWTIDQLSGKRTWHQAKTGAEERYTAPPSYRQELEKTASANVAKLMAAEEKDAAGLSADLATMSTSSTKSLAKLRTAAAWMEFLPGGDGPVKTRAEQRGDAVMKRGDATLAQGVALAYYEFAGSKKAAQVKAKQEEFARGMEQSAEKMKNQMKGAFAEKGDQEKDTFKKGQSELEKELGF
jgi:hypothetical protein